MVRKRDVVNIYREEEKTDNESQKRKGEERGKEKNR